MGFPDTGSSGAVPDTSQQHAQAGQGADIISGLLGQQKDLQQQITNTLPQANTPVKVSGTSTPYMKGAFSFSVRPPEFNAPQGHRDARNQGIAKTVAGVGNIIGSILKIKKEEKQRDLAHDIERIMGAQNSISEAQETLKSDPNNKDAQDAIAKNKQLINDTAAADPKKLKSLEKAFKIDHMDPSKNNTPEHEAMKMASKSFADSLAAKTPDRFVPNVQAQNKLQLLGAQYKQNQETLKTIVPMVDAQIKEEGQARRAAEHDRMVRDTVGASNASKERVEHERAAAQIQDTKQRGHDLISAAATRGSFALRSTIYAANKAYDKAMDLADDPDKIKDPAKRAAANKATAAELVKLQQSLPLTIDNNEKLLAAAPKHGFPGWRKPDDPANFDLMQNIIDTQKKQMKDVTDRLNVYNKTGEFPTDAVVNKSEGGNSGNQSERSGTPSVVVDSNAATDDYSDSNNSIYDAPPSE